MASLLPTTSSGKLANEAADVTLVSNPLLKRNLPSELSLVPSPKARDPDEDEEEDPFAVSISTPDVLLNPALSTQKRAASSRKDKGSPSSSTLKRSMSSTVSLASMEDVASPLAKAVAKADTFSVSNPLKQRHSSSVSLADDGGVSPKAKGKKDEGGAVSPKSREKTDASEAPASPKVKKESKREKKGSSEKAKEKEGSFAVANPLKRSLSSTASLAEEAEAAEAASPKAKKRASRSRERA
jgi:hypothetical protein